ncbi:MAG: hypothetical protein KF708_14920 [Pirellulales bacterium]|nr:hypothetical protein [Pirellulales bacterium]
MHSPSHGLLAVLGALFCGVGVVTYFVVARQLPVGEFSGLLALLAIGAFAVVGGSLLAWSIRAFLAPARVRHADASCFPKIPQEPVAFEGAIVHHRVTHELVADARQWNFVPSERNWRQDKHFLIGFGGGFLLLCAGTWSWIFHSRLQVGGWPVSILAATLITVMVGGTAFFVIGLLMRSGYQRLSRLTIPIGGGDLELNAPIPPQQDDTELLAGLQWVFLGKSDRRQLKIPRSLVQGVQICPWKVVVVGTNERTVTWAVQGLLVLATPEEDNVLRLPLLLTGDFAGGARLMRRLAEVLEVPYLFHADAAGWRQEADRAKRRQPLRTGGMMG